MKPRLVKANLPHLPCMSCYEVFLGEESKGFVVKKGYRVDGPRRHYWAAHAGRYGKVTAPFTTRAEALDALLGEA